MKNTYYFLVFLLHLPSFALSAPSRFFANPEVQKLAPSAFALQKEALEFVKGLEQETRADRHALVNAIRSNAHLKAAVTRWESFTVEEQIPFLREVFALECQTMGITPPELVIQAGITAGPAYFDFDVTKPGAGRVLLNPDALKKEKNQYASLSLLIHETRHAKQFQMAFPLNSEAPGSIFAKGYRAAFTAQKAITAKFSFCDFLTLLNEYEAFQFGNYVLGELTHWQVDILDMGTFASQYDSQGMLKIDLARLANEVAPENLLSAFNELEKVQKKLLE